jgi:pyrimidine-nucleoside phosphorylase
MTDMGQPLGAMAGNWIELMESVELLSGKRPVESEDLRELSLILAGWMIHLGGQADTPEVGYLRADAAMADGSALTVLMEMIETQGGDISVFEDMAGFHKPGATRVVEAWDTGYIAAMDTTMLGWAVQRTGAGREKAGEPVDPHAGIAFHARRGAFVEKSQQLATLYATNAGMLDEPEALLRKAIVFSENAPEAVPLVGRIFTRENAEEHLHSNSKA